MQWRLAQVLHAGKSLIRTHLRAALGRQLRQHIALEAADHDAGLEHVVELRLLLAAWIETRQQVN